MRFAGWKVPKVSPRSLNSEGIHQINFCKIQKNIEDWRIWTYDHSNQVPVDPLDFDNFLLNDAYTVRPKIAMQMPMKTISNQSVMAH